MSTYKSKKMKYDDPNVGNDEVHQVDELVQNPEDDEELITG